MKKSVSYILLLIFVILVLFICTESAHAQYFGKNKVNYSVFEWNYIETKNFDIYYSKGGYEIALIAASIAEYSYESISRHWNYTPRKRVPILVYNSHNDFSQTNVILETLEEGVGGFTELFKNRVVVPWEGSLAKFRHVIHHELTHAMYFDKLYGGVIESIVGREYLFQLPLWFAEGLAEHESQYWSTEADMIIRDGIISGYLPPIEYIYGGYLVYKGGESFFKFIQEKYGNSQKWIAGELLESLSTTKDLDKSYKSVVGKSIEDLSKEWHRKLKAYHWPEVEERELPEDFALQLTDHKELENYINMTPSFNPTGDRIAFLTDRNGYKEIMLMSAIDGKLIDTVVKGEKVGDYEEMHWLRGGITWSPDGKMIAFASKAGDKDAIHIKKIMGDGFNKIIVPEMDAIYSPAWSPAGDKILFCGIKDGKLDLFTVEIETLTYQRLTNDYFDESNPHWSPDGTKIVFASDRLELPYEHTINQITGFYNIFIINSDGTNIRRITTNTFDDRDPYWSPEGDKIVFTSDHNGITNLYYVDLNDMTSTPLTNLLTGVSSPCWSPDGEKIAFTSFSEGGWDIYLLKRPLKRNLSFEQISPNKYRQETFRIMAETEPDSSDIILRDSGSGPNIAVETVESKPYKLKFSPDMVNAFASYNTFYGFGGMGQLSLSDIMGNHRINIGANLLYTLEDSDLVFSYFNLKKQTNFGINLFHYKTYYRSYNWNIFSDRVYGGSLIASRPFSKFSRQDLSFNFFKLSREAFRSSYYMGLPSNYMTKIGDLEGITSGTIETEFVNDTTLWGYTGPINGKRYKINIEYAPPLPQIDLSFTTVELDYRKYFRIGNKYNFVTRFSGGASMGRNPRMFFLGGTDNWLNARIATIPRYLEDMEDLFFSRFPFPLRGYKYYEEYGRKYFLTNFEFRFPFIDYLVLGWPIPLALGNISGVLFTDIGSAWDKPVDYDIDKGEVVYDKSFHGGGMVDGGFALDDIKMDWGVGMRINFGFAVLRLDTAWRTNLDSQDPKPIFSVSLGPDF
ncbi:BamA/TamA family outer membrane protein [Candidatus Latescibacterota bacterium]